MQRQRLVLIALIVGTVLLAGLFVSCRPVTPAPTPRPTSTPPVATACTRLVKEPSRYSANPIFVNEQVIVTGPPQEIEEVVKNSEIKLIPLVECTLPTINRNYRLAPDSAEPSSTTPSPDAAGFPKVGNNARRLLELAAQQQPVVTRLYGISSTVSVTDTVQRLTKVGAERNVYADPNYLTGHLAKSACSDPNGRAGNDPKTQGSPFGMEGSPFGMEGSSGSGMKLDAPAADFEDQWAFNVIGARSPDVQQTGKGVDVAIFDTSPFPASAKVRVIEAKPAFVLDVIQPPLTTILSPTIQNNLPVKDHGLFVAGLVHGVAEGATIHLIRVLDDRGCGDVYTLIEAVNEFMVRPEIRDSNSGLVINLSLGVRQPLDTQDPDIINQITSLETTMVTAYEAGAVIVAAAGNDSVDHVVRLSAQLPAAYDFVTGVAASTYDNKPSCFSNQGNVVAPGGDADVNGSADPPTCLGVTDKCPNEDGVCREGLISLATASRTYYAYWTGTSFATPLVSGLAALAYQNQVRDVTAADAVAQTIRDGLNPLTLVDATDKDFGDGIINIPKSLQP